MKETRPGETRVAFNPETAAKWVSKGLEVRVEKNAGLASFFTDEAYKEAGCVITDDAVTGADIILKVNRPTDAELAKMKPGSLFGGFLWPAQNRELVDALLKAEITALGMESVPRISRAQKMDALSSMSSIAGYKAVLIAADALAKYMPMMMTAAGTIAPAKVLVLGAGVAGLQAIATAKRLGAVVEAFDVRASVKEQVESLGATFVDVPLAEEDQQAETAGGYAKELSEASKKLQEEAIQERVKQSDIVISTALIPGKKAPLLIRASAVEGMKPGSVIVDLAAEQGGNCELTQADQMTEIHNMRIFGPTNITAALPLHASQLYARNLNNLLELVVKDGALSLDFEDEVVKGSTVTHQGEVVSPFVRSQLGLSAS
ncbi:Re/Si-specific NAD(P)(+) transhydrogenase subunit alpha [Cyclonatronum sp.]|uniref:Re/Si-specific NAD(P)(+) transhydrogenase subunit alpha n=1 Tax=Cyclonatronum sp. TaxID=3024185 RepID=UPI0025BF3E41|nr:Re/Si-specific NAD(P)(+) transhydrogenase subunit alpha [Cyclonatronum sp.]